MDLRPLYLVVFLLISLQSADIAEPTDHIVGDNHGWYFNVNYTQWAAHHDIYAGDLISFRYPKTAQFNVFMVNKTGYHNCTTEGAVGNWSSGKDFIELKEAKRYYFICGNGMKVTVLVQKLPAAAPNASSHKNSGSASPRPRIDELFKMVRERSLEQNNSGGQRGTGNDPAYMYGGPADGYSTQDILTALCIVIVVVVFAMGVCLYFRYVHPRLKRGPVRVHPVTEQQLAEAVAV